MNFGAPIVSLVTAPVSCLNTAAVLGGQTPLHPPLEHAPWCWVIDLFTYLKNIYPSSPTRKKMLPSVKVIIAEYRHGSNERNFAYSKNRRRTISTPQRTPTTYSCIKTYEPAMLTDVASPLSQRPSRNAAKQLRTLEQRPTPQLQEKHSHSQHTRSICYHVPIIIVTVYHRIARRSNYALSNNERHGAISASSMTVTHLPIYKSGKLSNVASLLSQRPSRSATKQLHSLER